MADQPVNLPSLFDQSVGEFDRFVRSIEADQWDSPTPCSEWTVRDLVNHVVEEDLWAPGLLAGKTIEDLGGMDAFAGDQLGADPKGAWAKASADSQAAVHRDGAMDTITHLSFGDYPGSIYTLQLLSDHVIHAWDLARGIQADDTLDPDLVAFVYEGMKPFADSLSEGGSYGPPIEVPEDADVQTKLLGITGRKR